MSKISVNMNVVKTIKTTFLSAMLFTFMIELAFGQTSVELSQIRNGTINETFTTPTFFQTDEGVYFVTESSSATQASVWRIDLSTGRLSNILNHIPNLSNPSVNIFNGQFLRVGSYVYFKLAEEVFVYNISAGTSQRLFSPSGTNSDSFISNLVSVGNAVYFLHGPEDETSLWKITTAPAGTSKIITLPYSGALSDFGSANGNLVVFENKLFFLYNDGVHGTELWVSDTSQAGTQLFFDVDPSDVAEPNACGGPPCSSGIRGMTVVAGKLIFDTGTSFNAGRSEFWSSDGTAENTRPFANLDGAAGRDFKLLGNELLVVSISDFNLNQLWRVDPLNESISLVLQLYPESGLFNHEYIEKAELLDGKLYFGFVEPDPNTSEGSSYDIWESNGTAQGTMIVSSRTKPTGALSINASGISTFAGGVTFLESICNGDMMNSTCSYRVKNFDGQTASTIFTTSTNNISSIGTDEVLFVGVSDEGTLKIYSTSETVSVDIGGALRVILDDE